MRGAGRWLIGFYEGEMYGVNFLSKIMPYPREMGVGTQRVMILTLSACLCAILAFISSLRTTAAQSIPGAQRMVVGHTIQSQGINSVCDGKVSHGPLSCSYFCPLGRILIVPSLCHAWKPC